MNGITLALGTMAGLAIVSTVRRGSAAHPTLNYDDLAEAFRLWAAEPSDADPDDERPLRRWARAHGVTTLGAGAQRAVFAVPAGALKIAFDRDGYSANRNEAEVWEGAPEAIRRHLVPILDDSGIEAGEGAWVLMERVRATGKGRMDEATRRALNACGIQDLVTQNIADDGRLMDYGWLTRDLWAACTTQRGSASRQRVVQFLPGRRIRE